VNQVRPLTLGPRTLCLGPLFWVPIFLSRSPGVCFCLLRGFWSGAGPVVFGFPGVGLNPPKALFALPLRTFWLSHVFFLSTFCGSDPTVVSLFFFYPHGLFLGFRDPSIFCPLVFLGLFVSLIGFSPALGLPLQPVVLPLCFSPQGFGSWVPFPFSQLLFL